MPFDPNSARPLDEEGFDPSTAKPYTPPSTTSRVISDLAKSFKQGVEQIPGQATGLVDIPTALAFGSPDNPAWLARPFTTLANKAGEATGFRPGEWAKNVQLSPEAQAAGKEIDQAWEDPNAGPLDVAKAYATNPAYTANQVAQSLPSTLVGGALSRPLMALGARGAAPGVIARLAGQEAAPAIAGGVAEGAVQAGQQMQQGEDLPDQRRNAVAALGSGAVDAVIGAGAGRVANALGFETAQTLMAGGKRAGPIRGLAARMAGGVADEALLQELPQSMQEQAWQNFAEGKPLMEGVLRQGVEGALAGGVMGAGANVISGHHQEEAPPAAPPAPPMLALPAPVVRVDGDGNAVMDGQPAPVQDESAASVAGRAAFDVPAPAQQLMLPAPTVTVDAQGNAATADQRQAERGGVVETGAMGLGRNSEPVSAAQMGIDPSAGPMSAAAALAVDSGAHAIQLAKAQANAAVSASGEGKNKADAAGKEAAPLGSSTAAPSIVSAAGAAGANPQAAGIETLPHSLAPVDIAAHAGATSPLNARTEPTDAQKSAGNYALGHIKVGGLDISVENPAGSVRSGTDGEGKPWSTTMADHYGYIRRTDAADGDKLDVFVKPGTPAEWDGPVYVVDQKDPTTGAHDEHKAILGASSAEEASAIYHANYSEGWQGGSALNEMTLPDFKKWAFENGNKKTPLSDQIQGAPATPAAQVPAVGTAEQQNPAGKSATGQAGATAPADTQPALNPVAPNTAARYGQGGADLSEGGKPFKSKLAAIQYKNKEVPQGRVVKHEGGFAVREATDRELAARTEAGQRLLSAGRTASSERNPLLQWLGKHGLHPDMKSTFSPDKNPLTSGGVLFRAGGKRADELAALAAQDGFLPPGSDDADRLEGMVARAIAGERIAPLYSEGEAEKEADRRIGEHEQLAQDAAQLPAETVDSLIAMADDAFDAKGSNITTAEAMRLLGFTDQEIEDATTDRASAAQESSADRGTPDEPAAQGAPEGAQAGEGTAREEVAKSPDGKPLEAGQAEIDEANRLKYKTGDLERILKHGLDPTDGFDMHILANSMESARAYDAIMRAHKGDPSGIEYQKPREDKYPNIPAKFAVVLPDASDQGKWRVSYFDKNGFSSHHVEPTLTEAVQEMVRGRFTIESKGSLDQLSATKEWALGTDYAGLIDQLNRGLISHQQFLEKQSALNAAYEADKAKPQDLLGDAPNTSQQEAARLTAEKAEREKAQRNAAPEAGGFELKGSDRAADANSGQNGLFSRKTEPFYSALSREVSAITAKAQPAMGWQSQIQGLIKSGKVKADEVEWTGVGDWLKLQQGKVTKEQLTDFLKNNGVRVEEVTRGGMDEESKRNVDFHKKNARFASETLNDAVQEATDLIHKKFGQVKAANASLTFTQERPGHDPDGRLSEAYDLLKKAAPEGYDFNKINDAQDEFDSAVRHRDEAVARATPATKYGNYTLPGGENYREVLLTLPEAGHLVNAEYDAARRAHADAMVAYRAAVEERGNIHHPDVANAREAMNAHRERVDTASKKIDDLPLPYRSSHWDESNVLAHIRLNDRTDAQGKRVLFVEELQSDWAQAGRKQGFQEKARPVESLSDPRVQLVKRFEDGAEKTDVVLDGKNIQTWKGAVPDDYILSDINEVIARSAKKGVPNAPFVGKTDAWLSLAIKRIAKMAVDEGYDRVAFANGDQSASRYDLSKQIEAVEYRRDPAKKSGYLFADNKSGDNVMRNQPVTDDTLENYIGKEAARKLLDATPLDDPHSDLKAHVLTGIDLQVGGEGMKAFYDKIVPTVAKDVVRKLGGDKVGPVAVDLTDYGKQGRSGKDVSWRTSADDAQALGFDITPAMRANAEGGVPLFKRGNFNPAGIDRTAIDKAVSTLTRDWLRKPGIHVIESMDEAPPLVYQEWQRQNSQGATGEPEGFHYRGEVYLLAPHMASVADVQRVLYHESIGHFGLRGAFGDTLKPILAGIANMRPELIAKKAEQYGLDVSQESDRLIAAEEVLAEFAQTRPEIGWVRKAIAAIRTFLREHGVIKGPMSDDEILRNYLLPARGWVERAKSDAPSFDTQTQLERSNARTIEVEGQRRPIDNSKGQPVGKDFAAQQAFYKWFGDSAVTDAQGRPLVVYRGTLSDANPAPVSYFSANPEHTQGYAGTSTFRQTQKDGGNVIPAYLSMQNPLVMTNEQYWDKGIRKGEASEKALVQNAKAKGHDGIIVRGFQDNAGPADMFITVESSQIKSAIGNIGAFDTENPDIRFSRAHPMGTLTADQEQAMARVGGIPKETTVAERMASLRANLGDKVRQGLVDQFAPLKDLSDKSYLLARMSKGGDGTMEAAMLYGKPFLRDGVPDVDVNDGGFAKTLATLKGEHDRFLWWVAAQRAESLKSQGRENLFTDRDISELKSLSAGNFADGTARGPVFAAAMRDLNTFNESVLKMALDSGLIPQEAFDAMKDQPYVPFYRLMAEGDVPTFTAKGGLVGQSAYKKLKGGKEQLNPDLLQNMLLNWSNVYTASARNRAAQSAMQDAQALAIAYPVPSGTKESVRVRINGQEQHFMVEDPHVLSAISAISYAPSQLLAPLQFAKRMLTLGVTANPAFKIRNLIRDSLAAIAQSELSYNPIKNIAEGWAATGKGSQTFASMLAAGGVMRFGSTEDSGRVRRQIEQLGGELLDKKGWAKLTNQVHEAWEAYQELGDRGENVNRAALYQQLIAKGKSHAEAAYMARDLMDFSMSGSWAAVRFLTQTVPFFNARLQGLYKLGRAAKEDPAKFAIVTSAVMLASVGLWGAYSDDDDWKKREDWDRDTYWWFKIGDKAFRIPKPFEIGALGTLAERTAELAFDKEMTGERFGKRLSNMVFQTFAFDPTPQFLKPMVDVYANKDSFTDRAIESTSDERLRPQDRVSEHTSETARFLGQLGLPNPADLAKGQYTALSPKQVDFLLKGYFGWLATAALTASDWGIRPLTDRGERPQMALRDVFLAGNFVESLPTSGSRYVTQLYDQAKGIEQVWGSYQSALKQGDTATARQIAADNAPELRKYHAVEALKRGEGVMNAQAKRIEADKGMSPQDKRERLDAISARRDHLARQLLGIQ